MAFLVLVSCEQKKEFNKISVAPVTQNPLESVSKKDSIQLNIKQSIIKWKGTKMRGLGKHEGTISIQEGVLIFDQGVLVGGRFSIPMASLRVTDIPASDPIPLHNLTEHLKGKDFFDVKTYPLSILILEKVTMVNENEILISANLEIKGIRRRIDFAAQKDLNRFYANFKIDRFDWNIAYEGSWADRTLVDREIEFWVELVLN